MAGVPEILLADLSGQSHSLDLARLQRVADRALPEAWKLQREESVLASLREIEISLVDDPTIARVHGEFMDLPEATDVITFHHGEILISVDTAREQAVDYGRSLGDEVALYVIHGLLHLAGFKDKCPEDFDLMATTQESLLSLCLKET